MDIYNNMGMNLSTEQLIHYALARHEAMKSPEAFIEFILEDLQEFCMSTISIRLRPPQINIARNILTSVIFKQGREIVVEMSRQSGKSTLISLIVTYITFNFDKFFKIGMSKRGKSTIGTIPVKLKPRAGVHYKTLVFGPKMSQAQIIGSKVRDIIEALNELGANIDLVTKQHIKVKKYKRAWSQIFMESANSSASIEGLTGSLIIIDEAQAVDDIVLKKSIFPMGSHTMATRVLIGTPSIDLRTSRYFFERVVEDEDNDKDTFIYDYEINQQYSKDYKQYIEVMKRSIGENSIEFRTQYKLEWVEQEAKFIDREHIIACCKDRRCTRTLIHDNKSGIEVRNIVVGIDVGKKNDSTVVTVAQIFNAPDIIDDDEDNGIRKNEPGGGFKIRILDWFEAESKDYYRIIKNVYKFMTQYALQVCVVDAVGVGDPFFDILKAEWRSFQKNHGTKHHRNLRFEAFNWTMKNHHKLFMKLHTLFMMQRLEYPSEDTMEKRKFERQFNLLTRDVRGGMMKTDHPEGEHDDYCSSLALVVHAAGISYRKNEAKAGRKNKRTRRHSISNPMCNTNSPAFTPRDKMFKDDYKI